MHHLVYNLLRVEAQVYGANELTRFGQHMMSTYLLLYTPSGKGCARFRVQNAAFITSCCTGPDVRQGTAAAAALPLCSL